LLLLLVLLLLLRSLPGSSRCRGLSACLLVLQLQLQEAEVGWQQIAGRNAERALQRTAP
jgi:hypothetical protein